MSICQGLYSQVDANEIVSLDMLSLYFCLIYNVKNNDLWELFKHQMEALTMYVIVTFKLIF